MSTVTTRTIPTIDLAPYLTGDVSGKAAVAAAVDEACRNVGFLVVGGHGVPSELVAEMRAVTWQFLNLPLDIKLRHKMLPDRYRGYATPGSQSLAASYGNDAPPDVKQSFSIGPIDVPDDDYFGVEQAGEFFAPDMWPTERLPEFEAVWRHYYREMERLAGDLMRIFATGLGLPEAFFADKIDKHITDLSAIHYPPLTEPPLDGQMRGGQHTDFGSLTIVQRDSALGGLQVLLDGHWVDAPYVPDTFVINIGDLMAEWTNDRWVSTIHRVVVPDRIDDPASDRLSFTFFHQPNYDAVTEALPTCCSAENPALYGRTTSGAHFISKLHALRTPELSA
jgi:isopenicillin N synthase-like dioxygenase